MIIVHYMIGAFSKSKTYSTDGYGFSIHVSGGVFIKDVAGKIIDYYSPHTQPIVEIKR